jgi:pantoate--beta-alanine ligase
MKVIDSIRQMTQFSEAMRKKDQTIAFVPTMGFLHDGHLALMTKALECADHLVVSIFVNPAQFGPNEDFSTYPRALAQDLEKCRKIGVSAVFTPTDDQMYPSGFETYVSLDKLPLHLCGLSRPGFFKGVATVVTKLFNIVRPHVAVFGEKDFQQLTVIRRLVKDLNLDIDIVGVPIVREPDGLAMSSRNKYLSATQRPHALLLSQSLKAAEKMVKQGETDAARIRGQANDILAAGPEDMRVDYLSLCDPDTLEEVAEIQGKTLMALAVWLGKTRLIDNRVLAP